jgi:hypothetical protein
MSTYQLASVIERGTSAQLMEAAAASASRAVRLSLLALAAQRRAKEAVK